MANQNLIDEMLASQRAKAKEKLKSPTTAAVASAQVKEVVVDFDLQSVKRDLARQKTNNR